VSDSNVYGRFGEALEKSLAEGCFVQLRLSGATKPDLPGKVRARLVELKAGRRLSFALSYPTRDETRNFPVPEGCAWGREMAGSGQYRNALLSTTRGDWQLSHTAKGAPRLVTHRPATSLAPALHHDQKSAGLLAASARDWLHGLGVTDAAGQVKPSMTDKHRQINRYLEILSHLARDCGWLPATADPADQRPAAARPETELVLADMGCGKGYLTFGAWQLFRRQMGLPFRIIGIERRPELVAATAALALRTRAEGLEFIAGTISSVSLPKADALIALHACDTATDEAIRRGIDLGAQLIVVAPCCHQEARPQLGRPEPLAPLLDHGLLAGRFAEWLTDGLRALHLEAAGYQTKMIEFIASEHTPKNLMIAAVRRRDPRPRPQVHEQIRRLKEFAGLQRQALDALIES